MHLAFCIITLPDRSADLFWAGVQGEGNVLCIKMCIYILLSLVFFFVMEMSAERHDNRLGFGGVIMAYGGEDGTVIG
jgi:hypothetical protein